ncbi:MAG: hypothetical protein H7Z41_02540 [Cytophagales bacterium]|nr:hypothetical protein [Armatimonadota bacterium]
MVETSERDKSKMAKFVVKYHFDRDHQVKHTVEAESMSDARAQVAESIRGDDHFRVIEFRADENLYLIPLTAIRYIQVVDAEKELAHHRWQLD